MIHWKVCPAPRQQTALMRTSKRAADLALLLWDRRHAEEDRMVPLMTRAEIALGAVKVSITTHPF